MLILAGLTTQSQAQALRPATTLQNTVAPTRTVDYVVALVNSEPVTNADVRRRLVRLEQQLAAQGRPLPARDELAREVLEQLIVERAVLQQAREMGMKIDESTLANAEQTIAAQNQLSVEGFRRRIAAEGMDINRVREEIRNQLLLQRLRERAVADRVNVTESDVDAFIKERQAANPQGLEVNLGHILVEVPDGADAQTVAQRRARADEAADRLRKGDDLAVLARQYSQAPEAATGGLLGLRGLSRLPDLFVEATRSLPVGGVAGPVRSGAGFHVLKVVERKSAPLPEFNISQTHVSHILLRLSPQLSQEQAIARLKDFRSRILGGQASFEALAREFSQDGSSRKGGDLGWVAPGQFVPEFEQVMNGLRQGEISEPLVSRFGVHLIRLEGRRQVTLSEREQRDMARDLVRERKAEQAVTEWADEVRSRAYVEMREAPQP